MQLISNEEILDSEFYWNKNFKVKFIKINDNGTEWWQIIYNYTNTRVNCTSKLAAYKIALIAQQIINSEQLILDHHNILNKAKDLITLNGFRKKPIYSPKQKRKLFLIDYKKKYKKELSTQRIYLCPKCGKFDVEMELNEKDLIECIKCNSKVTRIK